MNKTSDRSFPGAIAGFETSDRSWQGDRLNLAAAIEDTMTQSNDLPDRVDRFENDSIDLKMAVSALLSTVEIHQRDMAVFHINMEAFRINADRTNQNVEAIVQMMHQSLQRMEIMASDSRGLQTENRRTLDILQRNDSEP